MSPSARHARNPRFRVARIRVTLRTLSVKGIRWESGTVPQR